MYADGSGDIVCAFLGQKPEPGFRYAIFAAFCCMLYFKISSLILGEWLVKGWKTSSTSH